MGTKNEKYLDIQGISENSTFFDSLNPSALFIIMGTLIFTYGYNCDLYY
jgi:hypothetical protein